MVLRRITVQMVLNWHLGSESLFLTFEVGREIYFVQHRSQDCIYNYINPLAEVHLDEGDDWLLFFEAFGISVTTNTWDGGGPCHSGCYSILTVRRDSQEFLLSKLVVILNRLKALEEHDKNEGSRERP